MLIPSFVPVNNLGSPCDRYIYLLNLIIMIVLHLMSYVLRLHDFSDNVTKFSKEQSRKSSSKDLTA